jgi:3-oxoacyl-[acyl-carrier protein] reductase
MTTTATTTRASDAAAGRRGILAGTVIVVTGAGHGIGQIAAIEMARQGALLQINNRSRDNGMSTVDAIRRDGRQVELTVSDVATADGAHAVIEDALRNYGRIDVLHNNAGFIWPGDFETMTEEQFDAVLGVHVKGSFYCTKAALPSMIERRFGRILFTGSPAGVAHAAAGQLNYSAAKGALAALTRCLYKEVYEYGITVNTIVPNGPTSRRSPEEKREIARRAMGWVRFGYTPGSSTPPTLEQIAPVMAWVVSDAAAAVTGRQIYVGGDRIGFYPDPTIRTMLAHPGGWTYEALRQKLRAVIPSGPPSPFSGRDAEPEGL